MDLECWEIEMIITAWCFGPFGLCFLISWECHHPNWLRTTSSFRRAQRAQHGSTTVCRFVGRRYLEDQQHGRWGRKAQLICSWSVWSMKDQLAAQGDGNFPQNPLLRRWSKFHCLVAGGFKHVFIVHKMSTTIYGIILLIDELIFFKMVKTTNQLKMVGFPRFERFESHQKYAAIMHVADWLGWSVAAWVLRGMVMKIIISNRGCLCKTRLSDIIRTYHISSSIIIYHHISSSIIIYHHLSSSIIIYHHLSSSIIIYHHLSASIIMYHYHSSS